MVVCLCGGDRWDAELVGPKFTAADGHPAQNAKYTCASCTGSVHDHARPLEGKDTT